MTYLITKASDDNYYALQYFGTIAELQDWIDSLDSPVIIQRNFWWREWKNDIIDALKCDEDTAREITKTRHNILIYDDYIE